MRRRPLSCFCLLLILLIFLGTVTGMTGRTDKEWDEKGCTLTGRVYDKEWVTGEEEKKIVYLEILKQIMLLEWRMQKERRFSVI